MSPRSFASLLLGASLGFGAAWSARHFGAPASSATPGPVTVAKSSPAAPAAAPSASSLPAPVSLLLPDLLAGAEADAALDAYLALPLLPAKDAPADELQARLDRLNGLLTLLPDSHLPRLLTALATREGDAEGRLRRAAFDVWVERDTQAAARWALALAPNAAVNAKARNRFVSQAAIAWSRDDFTAAYAWAGSLGDEPLRREILPKLLGQLAATDPAQAAALAQTGDEAFVRAAQRAVFEAWAAKDPAAALRGLGPALAEQRDRPWSVQDALNKWISKDPVAALDWAAAQPVPGGESYRGLLNNVAWNLTNNSPESVRPFMDALARKEDVPNRARVVQDLFGSWSRKDPKAALAWLDTVPDGAQRSDLISQALGYVEVGHPDEYMALARRLPDSSNRDENIAEHLSNWAKKDPEAALAWLSKHDEPELVRASRKVEGTLIASLASTDPSAAIARWQALPPGGDRLESAAPLAANWAKTDPVAATRWLAEQLAASPNDPRAANAQWQMREVAVRWVAKDPITYLEWAQSLKSESLRTQAVEALANTSLYNRYGGAQIESPPRAAYADKLAQIPDAALRDRILANHLNSWLRSDLRSARAWIESSDALSPEAAARLLTQTETTN